MNLIFNEHAPKKATNLNLNSDLIQKAKEEQINLSAIVEKALAIELKKKKEINWKVENTTAINTYNEFITNNGLFSDDFREV